jgi:hypothetical protein
MAQQIRLVKYYFFYPDGMMLGGWMLVMLGGLMMVMLGGLMDVG